MDSMTRQEVSNRKGSTMILLHSFLNVAVMVIMSVIQLSSASPVPAHRRQCVKFKDKHISYSLEHYQLFRQPTDSSCPRFRRPQHNHGYDSLCVCSRMQEIIGQK